MVAWKKLYPRSLAGCIELRSCVQGAVFYINKWFYINFRHSLWYKKLYHLPNYVLQLSKWENDIPSTQICLNISKNSLAIIYVMWWITLINNDNELSWWSLSCLFNIEESLFRRQMSLSIFCSILKFQISELMKYSFCSILICNILPSQFLLT